MKKRPLLICTDPGIDDFIALCYLLQRPEFEIVGMVALSGNVGLDITVNNTLLAAEICRRGDIPVVAGARQPLARAGRDACNIHGATGLGPVERRAKGAPLTVDAAAWIADTARACDGQLEILSLGPLTDIGRALTLCPDLPVKHLMLMGGGLCGGNATPQAEFNILADPEAAAIVFDSAIPRTMMGLDATSHCIFPKAHLDQLRASTLLGQMLPAMLTFYTDLYRTVNGIEGCIIHDAIAAIALLHPELFTMQSCRVAVVTEEGPFLGKTKLEEGAPNTLAAMTSDAAAIERLLTDGLQALYAQGI